MDNEREVKPESSQATDLVERSKLVFLREIVSEFRRKQQQYDVEVEFAKTKRNRSLFVPLTIIGLIAAFTVVVIGVTRYIQNNSRDITIDIDDFADVNLREVLDEAQRLQNELDAAVRELEQVISERDRRITVIERDRDQAISLLSNAALSTAQRNAQTNQISATAATDIDVVTGEAAVRIAELEQRIAELQAAIDQYDTRQLEQARAQAEILNNERELFELQLQDTVDRYESEIATLTERYETEIAGLERFQAEFEQTLRARHQREIAALILRYNPDVSGEEIAQLLDVEFGAPVVQFDGLAPYAATLESEGILAPEEYTALNERYRELMALVERLDAVPYRNSVPAMLEALDLRLRELVLRYETMWTGLEDSVVQRDSVIDDLQGRVDDFLFALDELTFANGDTGYILDPRDPDELVVFVGQIHSVVAGNVGYVFRTDDTYVGLIEFDQRGERLIARVVETAPNMELRAFDKVLVQVQ